MPILVYHKPKLIYCAIEKCAITRLIAYFGATYNIEKYYKDQLAEQIFHSSPIDHYDSRTSFAQICNKYPDYFSFAFIRNPFDRVASNYHYNKGGWKRQYGKYPSFEEYVKNMSYWNRVAPLCEYLDTDPNFIGKYESFKDDFDRLHNAIGIPIPDPHTKIPLTFCLFSRPFVNFEQT